MVMASFFANRIVFRMQRHGKKTKTGKKTCNILFFRAIMVILPLIWKRYAA